MVSADAVPYRFRPKLVPTLAVLLLFPVLIALGIWQTQRAGFKQSLQAEYDARVTGPVVAMESRLQSAEHLRFYPVSVRGVWELDRQLFVDNRVHRGVAGFHVLTPLHITGGEVRVLVNRGWIPGNPDRSHPPFADAPAGELTVTGVAIVPSVNRFSFGVPAVAPGVGWNSIWPHLNIGHFAEAVTYPVQPVVILMDPSSDAGGFTRNWARLDAGIKTHQSYAFQWFSLAVALVALYLLINIRPEDDPR